MPNGLPAGAPQIVQTPDNNLVVSFMTDEDESTANLDWPNKADVKVIFGSELNNGNVKWTTDTMKVSDASTYWPGTYQKGDDIMVVYSSQNVPYGQIVSKAAN